MERNKSIDIIRGMALILVVVYHVWVLTGQNHIPFYPLNLLISLGGEIGVSIFFLISGFGIYCSLENKQSFYGFLKKRFRRLSLEYYVFLIIVILFTSNAVYISKSGLKHIVLHVLFIHNFSPETAGSINGVLWTMAVIIHFYIIAIPLRVLVDKHPFIVTLLSFAFTTLSKFVCLHFVVKRIFIDQYFYYSRQLLPCVLDNFVMGMFIAVLLKKMKKIKKSISIILMVVFIILGFGVCDFGVKYGIHTDNISGYVWHTLLILCVGGVVLFYSMIDIDYSKIINRFMLFIAKYEYSIYIIHLILILNLVNYSELIQILIKENIIIVSCILISISVLVGVLYGIMIESLRHKIYNK